MMSRRFMARATVEFSQEDKSEEDKNQKDNGNSDSDEDGCIVGVGADTLGPSSLAVLLSTCVCSDLKSVNSSGLQFSVAILLMYMFAILSPNREVLDGAVVERVRGILYLVRWPAGEPLDIPPARQ